MKVANKQNVLLYLVLNSKFEISIETYFGTHS